MKLITLLLTISLLTACQGKPNHDFILKGTIKNYTGKINLYRLKAGQNEQLINTIKTSTNGGFAFNIKTDEEEIYFIEWDSIQLKSFPFINDVSLLTFEGKYNYEDDSSFPIKGSKASTSLNELFRFTSKQFKSLEALKRKQVEEEQAYNYYDTMIKANELVLKKDLLEYYNNAPHPIVQVFVLTILSSSNLAKLDEIKSLLAKSLKKYPTNKYLKNLENIIAQGKISNQKEEIENKRLLPSFSLPNTEGKTVSIDEFKGKYFLLDFWASWCGPCRQESPYLVKAFNQFKNKNFTIVSISLDEDKEAWLKASAKDKLTWTHLSDLKGWESQAAQMFGVTSIPFNLLIDPQGNIIASELRGDALEEKLKEVLK